MPISGPVKSEYFRKTASTAINVGDVLESASGAVNPADSSDLNLYGVSAQKIASTDTDYADNTRIMCWIMNPDIEWLADVGTGTATTANEGIKYDLTDADSIDLNATTHGVFTVTRFVSATQVIGRFNASYQFRPAV